MRATYRVTARTDDNGNPERRADATVVIRDDDGTEAMAWAVPTPVIAQGLAAVLQCYLLACTADDLHGLAAHLSKLALLKADEEAARST